MDFLPPPELALSISYEARAQAVALYCDAIVRMARLHMALLRIGAHWRQT